MKTVTYDELAWKLVPIDATEVMSYAGYDATRASDGMPIFFDAGFCLGHAVAIYEAMIKAAPPVD